MKTMIRESSGSDPPFRHLHEIHLVYRQCAGHTGSLAAAQSMNDRLDWTSIPARLAMQAIEAALPAPSFFITRAR